MMTKVTIETIYKHIILFLAAGIIASIVAYFRDAIFSNEPITLFVIMMFYIFGVIHAREIEK